MKYQVIWQTIAEEELASIWLASTDRNRFGSGGMVRLTPVAPAVYFR